MQEKEEMFFLTIPDLIIGKEYYQSILGFTITADLSKRGLVMLNYGEDNFTLVLKDQAFFEEDKPILWFKVANVEETYRQLVERGVTFSEPPKASEEGITAEFKDYFGNRLGIANFKKAITSRNHPDYFPGYPYGGKSKYPLEPGYFAT